MLPVRDLYKMIFEAYQKDLGTETLEDLKSGKGIYFIDGSHEESTPMEKTFTLFTSDFVLEVEQTFDFGDLYKESGKWTKEYYAQDVTEKYIDYKKPSSNKQIMHWISENFIKFIF